MKANTSAWLYVCLCLARSLHAAGPAAAGDVPVVTLSDVQILERARAANQDVYASLQSFVCSEEINRFKGDLDGKMAEPLDTVTARLSFERGVEQYSNILQNKNKRADMSTLPGAWSEGEFGTLLLQTQQLLATQKVDFDSFADFRGEQTAVYQFDVSAVDSPWELTVAGHRYMLPFHTKVWISIASGEILKIERAASSMPSEIRISGIEWDITLDHVALNGKPWLLPATGVYAVLYRESQLREWNLINFSGYQRYGAATALKFE